MITTFLSAALLAASAQAATPDLSQQSRALLRCSAAFALVSHGQQAGNEAALKWPQLETRGREFFVRTMAALMDAHDLSRSEVGKLAFDETMRLMAEPRESREEMIPACLLLLDASGV